MAKLADEDALLKAMIQLLEAHSAYGESVSFKFISMTDLW
jgi:hypothetical protein